MHFLCHLNNLCKAAPGKFYQGCNSLCSTRKNSIQNNRRAGKGVFEHGYENPPLTHTINRHTSIHHVLKLRYTEDFKKLNPFKHTVTIYITILKRKMHVTLCKVSLNMILACYQNSSGIIQDSGSLLLLALLDTRKIMSLPIICFIYIVTVINRVIFQK